MGRPLFCVLCSIGEGERLGNSGSYSGRGGERGGGLGLFYGVLRERGQASPTRRCNA